MSFISRFINEVSSIQMEGVFNPYRNRCELCDALAAPRVRRHNLFVYLQAVDRLDLDCAWLGRDLGYRGGRRTGLALTDEPRLADFQRAFGGAPVRRATLGPPLAERTAAEVWGSISELPSAPFLWNVFPFHPFAVGNPMSNRAHTARERELGAEILATLLGWLRPRRIVALGRDAFETLNRLGHRPTYVRHPSYGGKSDFIRGIRHFYDLPGVASGPCAGRS